MGGYAFPGCLKSVALQNSILITEQPELFLVGVEADIVIGTAMAGFDGHRGWVYYLAVAPEHQKRSYGRHSWTKL
ncbi:MAG: GNAT family N-acetyltransferase, partial [Leptolyngbya sp. SIO1D8]|nr:GNAT family N-acetyltransferase [Leptolyngbya sp. SIO1D8]